MHLCWTSPLTFASLIPRPLELGCYSRMPFLTPTWFGWYHHSLVSHCLWCGYRWCNNNNIGFIVRFRVRKRNRRPKTVCVCVAGGHDDVSGGRSLHRLHWCGGRHSEATWGEVGPSLDTVHRHVVYRVYSNKRCMEKKRMCTILAHFEVCLKGPRLWQWIALINTYNKYGLSFAKVL